MKGEMLTAADYPPPPPPPPPPEASPKTDSRKLLVVALLIVIVVVSAGVLFYLASGPSSTNPSPSPSATPTATSTATPTSSPTFTPTPTATSSGTNPIVNFRVGAYATYRMTTTTSSTESTISTLKMSVDSEETYNEVPCWLLSMTTETPTEGGTSKVVITWWMSKTGLEVVHIRMRMYVNNVLTYDEEYDPDETSTDTGEPPEPVDPQTILSYETVTVPAGTFANCAKAESGTATTKVDVWMHQDVPIWGIVKSETYSNSELQTKMELIDYKS